MPDGIFETTQPKATTKLLKQLSDVIDAAPGGATPLLLLQIAEQLTQAAMTALRATDPAAPDEVGRSIRDKIVEIVGLREQAEA